MGFGDRLMLLPFVLSIKHDNGITLVTDGKGLIKKVLSFTKINVSEISTLRFLIERIHNMNSVKGYFPCFSKYNLVTNIFCFWKKGYIFNWDFYQNYIKLNFSFNPFWTTIPQD